jgi:hypothetical protein
VFRESIGQALVCKFPASNKATLHWPTEEKPDNTRMLDVLDVFKRARFRYNQFL